MVKHVVSFKLKDNSEANCKKAQELILSMNGNVPNISNLEAHIDMLHSPRSYDVMLLVDVKDWDALDVYQKDPYHCGVVKAFMAENACGTVAFDYEY